MNRRALLVLAAVFGGFFLLFLVFLGLAWSAMSGQRSFGGGTGPRVGVIELSGQIGDKERGIEGRREAEEIRELAQDDSIRAMVVRIESPGGAVAPSQEIWAAIKQAREKGGKKVVCSMGQLAASGGYYIAVACDRIVANPGTLTGSIGVITQLFEARELVQAAKLVPHVLKTGTYKDSGSPLREFTEEDERYLRQLIGDIYEQFVAAVAEGRGMTVEQVRPLADGRVFTGAQAKESGLVDELGNFRDAVNSAMALAELEGEPRLVYPERRREFSLRQLLSGGARVFGRELVEGALDGLGSTLQPGAAPLRPPRL